VNPFVKFPLWILMDFEVRIFMKINSTFEINLTIYLKNGTPQSRIKSLKVMKRLLKRRKSIQIDFFVILKRNYLSGIVGQL